MFGEVLASELLGTATLTLLGVGVVANVTLSGSKGAGGGWLLITVGWGLAVFAGVFVAFASGAHINPAVTAGIWSSGAREYADGIPITAATTVAYVSGQLIGAFLGAVVAWLAYKRHYDGHEGEGEILGTFATAPAIRSYPWNVLTEVVGTFVLVLVVLSFGSTPQELGPLAVALLVVGIGASLGGPTGYAINPARDLGPRLAHALLPIRGKGRSDWRYSWVPIAGPLAGGLAAGLLHGAL